MRTLVHMRRVLGDLALSLQLPLHEQSVVSQVFEDNRAAELLATQDPPKLTPRTKHIAVKYFWVREVIARSQGTIQLKSIKSSLQLADILTKALDHQPFTDARKLTMGW